MINFQIGDQVIVTIDRNSFQSQVVDIAKKGIWVNTLDQTDMILVDVDDIKPLSDNIYSDDWDDLKEIHKNLNKALKNNDDDDIKVGVKIYDCIEDGQTYNVEINYYIDNDYIDGWYTQTFYGRFEDDYTALNQAKKRAKYVLRTVKGWFKNSDNVTVDNDIEVYHA